MEKYKEIIDILTRELEAGKYPVGSRFPSEYELGYRFDVSRLTANKAVRRLVDDGWLERGVRGAGTRVRLRQKPCRGQILYVGGLVMSTPNLTLEGLYSQAYQRGYYVTVASPPDTALNSFLADVVASGLFAGIVTADYFWFDDQVPGLPVVYLGNYHISGNHTALHYVTSDNEEISRQMVKEIVARGYRCPVVYADYNYQLNERSRRTQGMMQALQELGFPDPERRLFVGADHRDASKVDAMAQLRKILGDYPETDAILTVSDNLAMRMHEALLEAKIPSPQRILVTGFGNFQYISGVFHFPSVDQHLFHIGVAAADMLLDIIEGKAKPDEPHLSVIPSELVNLEYVPTR